MRALVVLVLLFGGLQLLMRFAPSPAGRFHIDPEAGDVNSDRAARITVDTPLSPREALEEIDKFAATQDRVRSLAGSVDAGRITYVARSKFWGFPDYITIGAAPKGSGSAVTLYSRARFGRRDFGVNAARVARWHAALPRHSS